jgi:hypothetical protein
MAQEWTLALKVGLSLAKLIPWGRIVPTLAARLWGVLTVEVLEIPRKDFPAADGNVVYTMSQVWVRNGTRVDFKDVRCRIRWRRLGGTSYESQEVDGIWCRKQASGLASYPGGIEEQTDLPSNGDSRHLGLIIKDPATGEAFIVCTGSYHALAYPHYKHPAFRLDPGQYEVIITLEAHGGLRGQIVLQVHHAGGSSDIVAV